MRLDLGVTMESKAGQRAWAMIARFHWSHVNAARSYSEADFRRWMSFIEQFPGWAEVFRWRHIVRACRLYWGEPSVN